MNCWLALWEALEEMAWQLGMYVASFWEKSNPGYCVSGDFHTSRAHYLIANTVVSSLA